MAGHPWSPWTTVDRLWSPVSVVPRGSSDEEPHTMLFVARTRCLVARGVRGVLWRRTAPLEVVVAPKRVVRCALRPHSCSLRNAHAQRAAAELALAAVATVPTGRGSTRLAYLVYASTADTTSPHANPNCAAVVGMQRGAVAGDAHARGLRWVGRRG